MSDDEIEMIYDAGQSAAKRGGKSADCPYAIGTEEHSRWMLGFEDGGGYE